LESGGSEVLAGAGLIGDSIGTAATQFMGATGIFPAAPRFTTGAISTGVVEAFVAEFMADAPEFKPAGVWPREAECTTVLARFPGLSTEIGRLLGDTRNPAARAASAPAPLAVLIMEGKPEAFRRAARPALEAAECAAEADSTAVAEVTAAADGVSPRFPG